MRRRVLPFAAAAGLVLSACSEPIQPEPEAPSLAAAPGQVPDQYIVVFTADVARVPDAASDLARQHAATPLFVYQHSIRGFAARMSAQAAARMARDPRVAYVEPDGVVQLSPGDTPGGSAPPGGGAKGKPGGGSSCTSDSQSTPWGIGRVGGAGNGSGRTAWIIDTGIDFTHCDLNVDVSRAFSAVNRSDGNDDHGHGTHVAGTIAALDNGFGVIGVAAGATVVPVKVLDRRGSGTWSGVIAGIDYVAAIGGNGDVANMSLGGGANQAVDDAVQNAAATGVRFALAAGNEGVHAGTRSPARVNGANVYTVSAVNGSDVFASWSNYGNPPVDYAAPGVSVLSTWKGGGYNTISGTSMATPHVAGILLLGNVATSGFAIGDPDGNPDPIAHR